MVGVSLITSHLILAKDTNPVYFWVALSVPVPERFLRC
jgi:hypothetical protein